MTPGDRHDAADREEARRLRYDLDLIRRRAREGHPGRTDAEREPLILARLRALAPPPVAAPAPRFDPHYTPPGTYRDPERT